MSTGQWELTKEILEKALRLASQEREAYLGAACGADTDLRRELESLIASHGRGRKLIPGADASEVLQLTPPPVLSSGTKLGPYELIELLGSGGMGSISGRETYAWNALLRSSFYPPRSPQTMSGCTASSEKHAPHLPSTTPI